MKQLASQIPWWHNVIIMQKCKNIQEREFYIKMVIKFDWSRANLIDKISEDVFAKWAISQNNFQDTLPVMSTPSVIH